MSSAPQSPAPQQSPATLSPRSPAGASPVAAAPRGPGVVVPFAAPPRDPDKSRLVVGIIVGVTAFVLVCGGALAGAVGVLVWSSGELAQQSVATAETFLDDIVADEYGAAYKSLCGDKREDVSREEFAREWADTDVVAARNLRAGSAEQGPAVFAEIELADGAIQEIELIVVLDQENMRMSVCDWNIPE